MNIKLTIIIPILLMSVLMGCTQQNIYKPKPFGLTGPAQDAPENYLAGWNDGCETGMGTMSTSYYKTFYRYKIDAQMVEDPEYYRAWRDAYTYCRHYTFKYVYDGFDHTSNKALDGKICVFCFK